MRSILVALTGVVAPGFAHGLMGQRRSMWITIAALWLSVAIMVFTIWAFWLAMGVVAVSMIEAGIRHRRLTRNGGKVRWDWLFPLMAFAIQIVVGLAARTFVVEAFKTPSSSMYPTLQIGDHLFIEKVWRSYERGEVIVFRQPCEPNRDYIKRIVAVGGDTVEIRCSIVYINGKAVPRELVDENCTYEDYDDRAFSGGESHWFEKTCSRYRETMGSHTFEIFHDRDQPQRDRQRSTDLLTDGDQKDFPQDTVPRYCGYQPEGEQSAPRNQEPGKIVVTGSAEKVCALRMHYVVPDQAVFVLGDNRGNSNDSRYWGNVPIENIKGHAIGKWLPLSRFGTIR